MQLRWGRVIVEGKTKFGACIANARALAQKFGETLARSMRNRIRTCGEELTCAFDICVFLCVHPRQHVYACDFINQMASVMMRW